MTMHKEALKIAMRAWLPTAPEHVIHREDNLTATEAAIRAYLDARGMAIVPKQATIEMRRAGNMQALCGMDEIISAAIAAAPDPFTEGNA